MSYDDWKATDPSDLDPFNANLDDADFDVVFVTCKECQHQIEAGEDCPYCEKSAETGSLR